MPRIAFAASLIFAATLSAQTVAPALTQEDVISDVRFAKEHPTHPSARSRLIEAVRFINKDQNARLRYCGISKKRSDDQAWQETLKVEPEKLAPGDLWLIAFNEAFAYAHPTADIVDQSYAKDEGTVLMYQATLRESKRRFAPWDLLTLQYEGGTLKQVLAEKCRHEGWAS